MSGQINLIASGICITSVASPGIVIEGGPSLGLASSSGGTDISGNLVATLSAVGNDASVIVQTLGLNGGTAFLKSRSGPVNISAHNGSGTIVHDAMLGWLIDGKTIAELVKDELCKLFNCD